MTQNPMDGSKAKLRLKNTDTNRFKVETGSMPAIKPPAPAPAPRPETPEATQTISDPLSLRDTATGKLKRVTDTQTSASALAPSQISPGPEAPQKTETVRLKVVRSTAKPGVNLGTGPQTPVLPATPGINAATIKLGDRAAPLPAALKSTGHFQREPAAGTAAAPAAAPKPEPPTATSRPAPAPAPASTSTPPPPSAPSETPAPSGTAQVATPSAAPKGSSSTIKINIMRPGTAAKPAAEPAAPGTPAAAAPAEPAAPAAEAPAGPNSNTLKIRPSTPGAPKVAGNQSAGATVKLTPPAPGAPLPTSGLKLSLKKEEPASGAETGATQTVPPPVQAGTTQAVPPPTEEKKGGLKIKTGEGKPLNSAATQAVPLPAPAAAAPSAEAKAAVAEAPAASPSPAVQPAPATGSAPGMLETIAALAACLAMIAGAVRIVMDLMQQF